MIEGRIGELVEEVWDHRPDRVDPLVVRVLVEALRVLKRAPHSEVVLAADPSEQEAFIWQISRLAALEPAMTDYLEEAPAEMARLLRNVPLEEHRDWLLSLTDLRAETAEVVLPLLDVPSYPFRDLAVDGRFRRELLGVRLSQ